MRLLLSCLLPGILMCGMAGSSTRPGWVTAQESDKDERLVLVTRQNKTHQRQGRDKPEARLAALREAEVMEFVQRHHAELAELLVYLKENRPKEYQRAVRQLARTSQRLANIEKREPQRYELELKVWKAASRGKLLAARLTMNETPRLRKQLRRAVEQQLKWKIELARFNRDKAARRVSQLDAQIQKLTQNREREIDRQMRTLLRKVSRTTQQDAGRRSNAKRDTNR